MRSTPSWSVDPRVAQPRGVRVALRALTPASIPTLGKLNDLINNPSGGDLTSLLQDTPALARIGSCGFPRLIRAMNDSQAQLDTSASTPPTSSPRSADLGQAAAYYDANGHYTRTQPVFGAFGAERGEPASVAVAVPPVHRAPGRPRPLSGRRRAADPRRLGPVARARLQARHDPAWPMRRLALIARPGRGHRRAWAAGPAPRAATAALRRPRDLRQRGVRGRRRGRADRRRDVGSIQSLERVHHRAAAGGQPRTGGGHACDRHGEFTPFHTNATCAIRPQSLIGESTSIAAGHHELAGAGQDHQRPRRRQPTCCR